MQHFRIKQGDWPSADGAPPQRIQDSVMPSSAALVGGDAPRLQPKFEVAEGDTVTTGQVLFRDRKHPEIAYVAPISGTVSDVVFGPRRTLSACVIQAKNGVAAPQQVAPLDGETSASVRKHLQSRGMWPAFCSRPFGRTPSPKAQPAAIFINAVHASLLMPDPSQVLDGQTDAFRLGVSILTKLTDGVVHICQSQGNALVSADSRIRVTCFSGTRAAGLVGTHVDRLHPVGFGPEIWSIGYQDVAAIGHLFQTGNYFANRVISVTGSVVSRPKFIQTCIGAKIADLCKDEPAMSNGGGSVRLFSGDPATGHEARFLGRFDQQVALEQRKPVARRSRPGRQFGKTGPLIPTSMVEHALAVDILPVPLMRALSVGDGDAAQRLGCLALVEEDIAVLSRYCTSGADYGVLLRRVLDDLMEDAA